MSFWNQLLRRLLTDDLIYLIDNTYYLKIHKTADGYGYALYDLNRQLLQDGHLDQKQNDHILDAGSQICHLLDFSAAQLELIPPSVWECGLEVVCNEA